MPRIISSHDKFAVIDDWLSGESRSDIAIKRNMGNGTVYNIIQEWRIGIGFQKADSLRDLTLKLKNTGLTVSECANGLRSLMIFKKYGIKEDEDQNHLIYFLKEIYTKCQEVGLTPQLIFDYISDILKFSTEISISHIPQFLKKKTDEKEKLEIQVQELSKKRDELTEIKEEIEHEIQGLSKNKETMTKIYQTFTIAKYRLNQYGIGMENIDNFVRCVVGVSKEGYNPIQILAKIADYENLEKEANHYKSVVSIKRDELAKLDREINLLKDTLNRLNIKVDFIKELEGIGFGLNELRTLIHILNEIGLEHNENFDEIRKEFFNDVKNYEEVIGSRKEIDRLKKERKILEEQTFKEREKYNAYPKIIESITRLAGAKVSEDDIVKIDKILSMTDYYTHKDKSLYKKTLIDDLQQYVNLKLAIKKLESIEIDLQSKKRPRDKLITKEPTTVVKNRRKKSTHE